MAYTNVTPRYMQGRAEKNPESRVPEKDYIPRNPQFGNVAARYLEPKDAPARREIIIPPSPFHDSVEHKRMSAKMGFGGVGPKFNDEQYTHTRRHRLDRQANNGSSPKEQTEKKIHSDREIRGWRSPGRQMPANFTFNDVQGQTDSRLGTPRRNAVNAVSSVKEFIRDGTPLKHHSQYHDPKPKHEDPENQLPKWHSGGVSTNSFKKIEKETLRTRPQYSSMEDRVKEQREALKNKKVPRVSTPRCAQFSPAFQVAQLEREIERQRSSEAAHAAQAQSRGRSEVSPDPDSRYGEEQPTSIHHRTGDEQQPNVYTVPQGSGDEQQHEGAAEGDEKTVAESDVPLTWVYKGRHTF